MEVQTAPDFSEFARIDFSQSWDLGITLHGGVGNPNAFGMEEPLFEVFRAGSFVGDVSQGGACNVVGVKMNPHGNGTHTECAGHIGASPTDDWAMNCGPGTCLTLDQALTTFWFKALLLSVEPLLTDAAMPGQRWIAKKDLEVALHPWGDSLPAAVLIRTLPFDLQRGIRCYTGQMPPAFEPAALEWLARSGVMHLLTDLPSVDPEHDGGRLLAHRAFWFPEGRCRRRATITEMIDAESSLPDGFYALNLMVPRWSLDAAPSRPVIYALHSV